MLTRLSREDPLAAEVVKLHYFAGPVFRGGRQATETVVCDRLSAMDLRPFMAQG